MSRITCKLCGKRRKPWFEKYRGDHIVVPNLCNWGHVNIHMWPFVGYMYPSNRNPICCKCVEECINKLQQVLRDE